MTKDKHKIKYNYKNDPGSYSSRVKVLENIFKKVLLEEGVFYMFSFKVNPRYKKQLGGCSFNPSNDFGVVDLSKILIQHGRWEEVLDTLLHELAHACDFSVRGKSDHSDHWKRWAIKLGADPTRTANLNNLGDKYKKVYKKTSKYTLVCPNCNIEIPAHRKRKRITGCAKCNKNTNKVTFIPFTVIKNY